MDALEPIESRHTVEELAVALDFETIWDLDVIENLEMLERMMAVEEGAG